ncbi:IS3 family transposase [Agrococcus sp. Ld7]|uniref:IS3 family transposase n=1 Tax=Agrococcus sp. Ld7 TaxID=649148 RepID=UPI00386D9E5E
MLLQVAGLPRSTFFYHQARSALPDPQAELKAEIRAVFKAAKKRYGYRRIHAQLRRVGWIVAKKTVLKLMRQLGLKSKVRQRKFQSFKGEVGKVVPNLLQRDFDAAGPNQKWVTDVTEFRIGETKVFLSPVLDLHERKIVSYSRGVSPTLELTNSALKAAVATLERGQQPIVHSDQGFQYQHASWRKILRGKATQSMSRKGNCLDNAVMEGFFGHLKEEMFNHDQFDSIDTFLAELDDYMRWYNEERISSTRKDLSPVEHRTQVLTG